MQDKETIQKYINNFRRHIAPHLKSEMNISSNVYPTATEGAILEFTIEPGIENEDNYKEVSATTSTALSNISQHAFGGNLNSFTFKGTNIVLEGNRIIFIKDDTQTVWSDKAAKEDVETILSKSTSV